MHERERGRCFGVPLEPQLRQDGRELPARAIRGLHLIRHLPDGVMGALRVPVRHLGRVLVHRAQGEGEEGEEDEADGRIQGEAVGGFVACRAPPRASQETTGPEVCVLVCVCVCVCACVCLVVGVDGCVYTKQRTRGSVCLECAGVCAGGCVDGQWWW